MFFKIYTGKYRPRNQKENLIETKDNENFLKSVKVGVFVAVKLSNCMNEPVIGKVVEVSDETFKIHYWKGTYNGKWQPQNIPRSRTPWTNELPKSAF